jgi:hypothetical protein
LAFVLGLAGCGDGGDRSHDYPAAAKRNFMAACERSSGGDTNACSCGLANIEQRLTYAQFKREDAALRRGRAPSRVVADAIADCVK